MKKTKILMLIILAVSLVIGGCTKSLDEGENEVKKSKSTALAKNKNEMPKQYIRILQDYYDYIMEYEYESEMETYDVEDSKFAIWEMLLVYDKETVLKSVGYKAIDINGDDAPELLIGNTHNKAGENEDGGIYALFTLVDDKPQLVLTGTARDQYYYLGEGKLVNINSGGYGYSLGLFELGDIKNPLKAKGLYFYEFPDDERSEVFYYYNSKGEYDVGSSKELEQNKFNLDVEKLTDRIQAIDYTSFLDYEYHIVKLFAFYATEYDVDFAKEENSYNLDDPNSDKVLFQANGRVKDLKILAFENVSIDEDGREHFDIKELHKVDSFGDSQTFVAGVPLIGVMPTTGISYIDNYGDTRTFVLYESGKTGELILREIER